MKKTVHNQEVYYQVAWSGNNLYDKYSASRILPELSGVLYIYDKDEHNQDRCLLIYACWRDGLRVGLKKLMDPTYSPLDEIQQELEERDFYYKYTVVDTNPKDLQDIMYWLILEYKPLYNKPGYEDSKRYKSINIRESLLKKGQIVERFPF